MATNYAYGTATATNKVVLAYIKTTPNNVVPWYQNPRKAIKDSNIYGINGGFFTGSQTLLSIAIKNGVRVGGGGVNDYGSGYYNGIGDPVKDVNRGTFIWDNARKLYRVQQIKNAGEIETNIKNGKDYWAQGGTSMCMLSDTNFTKAISAENMPDPNDANKNRAGLVCNGTNIWLVVSTTGCTLANFRAAIKEKIGSTLDGIFLDGSGSAQLRCYDRTFIGSDPDPGRLLPEVLALVNVN